MTEMVKPLRDMMPLGKYQRTGKLIWTDSAIPFLQTDASDYSIGGYLYMVTNGKVRVVRFFSEALEGAQLNWPTREKECSLHPQD
jgi:hypothetical protein